MERMRGQRLSRLSASRERVSSSGQESRFRPYQRGGAGMLILHISSLPSVFLCVPLCSSVSSVVVLLEGAGCG